MSDIYDLHQKAFANVSAYVVLNGAGERVATVAFKFPRDGAGRLWCYLHVFGYRMVRGYAGGYGYDKRSAAIHAAVRHVGECVREPDPEERTVEWPDSKVVADVFRAAIQDKGYSWDRELENMGFRVLQAV